MVLVAERTHFRQVQKLSVVEDIIEQIKGLVRSHDFAPGSRLPSERELARQLGVSRPSVREALRTLALMGVLDTRHGSGTQISESSANVLKAPFDFLAMFEQPTIGQLYEACEPIECFLAGLAAERRTDADLDAMKEALDAMRDPAASAGDQAEANFRFHEALAVAGGNLMLQRVLASIDDQIRKHFQASRGKVPELLVSYEIHEEIYEAIRRRDAQAARQLMCKHANMATENLRRSHTRRRGREGGGH